SNYISSLTVNSTSFNNFLHYFHEFVSSSTCTPFNLQLLTSAENEQFHFIAKLAKEKLMKQIENKHKEEEKENKLDIELLSDLIKYWLGLGSFDSILETIQFCLESNSATNNSNNIISLPSNLISNYILSYLTQIRKWSNRLLKYSSQTLFSDLN